ncbi:MAG: diacylglycerol kinase family protein [Myxococcales bacterium]
MRAAVIVNPNAGALRRNPKLADRLRESCRGRAELLVTQDDAHLGEVVQTIADHGVERVAVVGGDGTASVTLTSLWKAYADRPLPSVSFLRGGTMNTIANSLGISRRNPGWLLDRTLQAWGNGESRKLKARPTLRIGDRLGFLFGTGLMYGYLAEYYAVGNGQPTPVTAATVLAKAVGSALVGGKTFERILQPRKLQVVFSTGHWETRNYMTIGAGTVVQAGLGFQPFYRAFESDERFHLLAVKGRAHAVAQDMPRIWLGRGFRPETAEETTTEWAELSCADGAFGYFVDGDLLTAPGHLSLGVGPRFNILRI